MNAKFVAIILTTLVMSTLTSQALGCKCTKGAARGLYCGYELSGGCSSEHIYQCSQFNGNAADLGLCTSGCVAPTAPVDSYCA